MVALRPFKVDVSDEQLKWINDRVKSARIPTGKHITGEELDSFGLPYQTALRLHNYWTTKYDWQTVEKNINQELKMFTLPIDHNNEEHTIHFVYHRSKRPDAIPLLFLHGWPGSFLEVRKILHPLTFPESLKDPAYHVVAPSLPGFGFSSRPSKPCSPMNMGAIMNKLMLMLDFDKYMVQGGDWGSFIGRSIAINFPQHCRALHLNMFPAAPPSPLSDPFGVAKLALAWLTGGWNLSTVENQMLKRMKWWLDDESGYANIQGTKPQTISYALSDSPFGQVCWIRDKLDKLVAPGFELSEEETLTWCMPYVINASAGPAEIYKWSHEPGLTELKNAIVLKMIPSTVSVGCSAFPYEVMNVPQWWAKSCIAKDICFWREHTMGGHFAAYEVPDLLVDDVRCFTKALRPALVQEITEIIRTEGVSS